jgi:hypothetical protein
MSGFSSVLDILLLVRTKGKKPQVCRLWSDTLQLRLNGRVYTWLLLNGNGPSDRETYAGLPGAEIQEGIVPQAIAIISFEASSQPTDKNSVAIQI